MIPIDSLLRAMMEQNASDLHLRVGIPPVFRINGELMRAKMDPLTENDMIQYLTFLMREEQRKTFYEAKELDFAKGLRGVGRFRINAFRQRGTTAMAIRAIKIQVPQFQELNMPDVVLDLAMRKRGLVLVTGITGSGKSTLLASMINHINHSVGENIVTIEDPIEYLFHDNKSTIVQREIGTDSNDFEAALRSSFRQDPDVILIGEIRDRITMEIALSAADTGHLVMSTLHTMNAVETISRVISFFPPHQHDQIRLVLSSVLVGIISLRLLPRKDGAGLIPASEILINNATIAEYINDPEKQGMILPAIREGYTKYGSRSFDQTLLNLYREGLISMAIAKQNATNPDDFELKAGGIEGTSDRSWAS